MRIRENDKRKRLYENLLEASSVGTKSGALDEAARFYCRMRGHNGVNPRKGKLEELMATAVDEGSVTPEQIASIMDSEEIPVSASTEWAVGQE